MIRSPGSLHLPGSDRASEHYWISCRHCDVLSLRLRTFTCAGMEYLSSWLYFLTEAFSFHPFQHNFLLIMRFTIVSSVSAVLASSASAGTPTNLRRSGSNESDDGDICHCYGIDFQNEGSYFINSQSNASFTCVSQFENSQGDPAYIILINDDDDDQWECTTVSTTPDNTAQLSTCPITKNQMSTGNWSIVTMGNNNNGTAFAWERNFYLSVGIPETTTITPIITYTQTTTPSTTATSKRALLKILE